MSSEENIALQELTNRFSWIDYLVFAIMLSLSAAIGIFYGCISKKKQDTKEFLMAGKSMGTFPVAMSLIASFMSAISLLGIPSEVYANGFIYWWMGLTFFIVMPIVAWMYLPVFWDLQVTSAYEYLEIRFSKHVRRMASFLFILQMTLYMAIVIYAPSLALAQVTGVNVYLSVCLISFVCMFYTTLGGMKAVLWTDTLQVGIMYFMIFFVVIKGIVDQGGLGVIWDLAEPTNRTILVDWDPDPKKKYTFWSLMVGGTFIWLYVYAVNQAQVQRYLCVKTIQKAKNALWINMVALCLFMFGCVFGGMAIFGKYADCDPVKSGLIGASDQLLPLFVMDLLGEWRGVPGLFVAGVFSGALSTVSSGMNSLAAITLEDFVKAIMPKMTEKQSSWFSKGLSFFYGVLTFALVFVAEQLGGILSAALSVFGIIGGPLFGVFSLGMFVPWANSVGAIVGLVFSTVFTLWMGIGFQVAVITKSIVTPKLPVDVSGCDYFNSSMLEPTAPIIEEDSLLNDFYKTSYLWYSPIGYFAVMFVGTLVSFLTGPTDVEELNPRLMSPAIHWIKKYIPPLQMIGTNYSDVEEIKMRENQSTNSFGDSNIAYNQSFNTKPDLEDNGTKF